MTLGDRTKTKPSITLFVLGVYFIFNFCQFSGYKPLQLYYELILFKPPIQIRDHKYDIFQNAATLKFVAEIIEKHSKNM